MELLQSSSRTPQTGTFDDFRIGVSAGSEMARRKYLTGVDLDGLSLLRRAMRRKIRAVQVRFLETDDRLGHVFELLDSEGNVVVIAWFDSNANPHFKDK